MCVHLTSSQASKRRCQEDCTSLRLSVDSLQAKGEQFDALQAKLDEVEKDNRALQQNDTMHAITMKSLAETHEADRIRLHELDRKVELLTMDKMFLNKELDIVSERGRAADKERERLNNKVDDLRKHKEQLVQQLSQHAKHNNQQHSTAKHTEPNKAHSRPLFAVVELSTELKCVMSTSQRMRRSWQSEAAAHSHATVDLFLSFFNLLTRHSAVHCLCVRLSCSDCRTGQRASWMLSACDSRRATRGT